MLIDVLCYECGQDAREPDDRTYSILIDNGKVTRAADVCRLCKLYHIALNESEGKVPRDPQKALEALRRRKDHVNYVVAAWIKTTETEDSLIDRRYVVNLDGSISSWRSECNHRRDAKSFVTDGWQPYTPKQKIRNAEEALRVVGSALEAQGYRREI